MKLFIALLCAVIAVSANPAPSDDCCGGGTSPAPSDGCCTVEAKPADLKPLDWWENGVFYQIYPRSFKDNNADGVGDIAGIIAKLDYLQELGVTGVWLSPIFKSPMVDFGYDISDFYDIDKTFGTMADIEQLFSEAKKRNIKVILDFVPNHSSDQHEWFKKSAENDTQYRNYYIWHPGKVVDGVRQPPNNWVRNLVITESIFRKKLRFFFLNLKLKK